MNCRAKALAAGVTGLSIWMVGIWLLVQPLGAVPAYAQREEKACGFCHPGGNFADLTDAGRYYSEHDHSLEGYGEPQPESPEPTAEPAKPAPGDSPADPEREPTR